MNPRQITCARCNKPVDRTEWWDESGGVGDRVLRVYCHGATDEMRIDFRELTIEQVRQLGQAQGVAFTTLPLLGVQP